MHPLTPCKRSGVSPQQPAPPKLDASTPDSAIADGIEAIAAALSPLAATCRPALTDAQVIGYVDALADLPPALIRTAARAIAATRIYSTWPMPGEIREAAAQIAQGDAMDVGAAWDLCLRAVRRHSVASEAAGLASLPPAAREALRRFGWRRLCDTRTDELGVAFAHFRDCFKPVAALEHQAKLLPKSVKAAIAAIGAEKPVPLKIMGGDTNDHTRVR